MRVRRVRAVAECPVAAAEPAEGAEHLWGRHLRHEELRRTLCRVMAAMSRFLTALRDSLINNAAAMLIIAEHPFMLPRSNF